MFVGFLRSLKRSGALQAYYPYGVWTDHPGIYWLTLTITLDFEPRILCLAPLRSSPVETAPCAAKVYIPFSTNRPNGQLGATYITRLEPPQVSTTKGSNADAASRPTAIMSRTDSCT